MIFLRNTLYTFIILCFNTIRLIHLCYQTFHCNFSRYIYKICVSKDVGAVSDSIDKLTDCFVGIEDLGSTLNCHLNTGSSSTEVEAGDVHSWVSLVSQSTLIGGLWANEPLFQGGWWSHKNDTKTFLQPKHMYRHMHIRTQAYTHALIHTDTDTHAHILTHTDAHTRVHTQAQALA